MASAYEDILLNYARPSVKINSAQSRMLVDGAVAALEFWVSQKSQAWAFEYLMSRDQECPTAEELVLKYSDQFDTSVCEQANARLDTMRETIRLKKLETARYG